MKGLSTLSADSQVSYSRVCPLQGIIYSRSFDA